jgi:hypothetical protein
MKGRKEKEKGRKEKEKNEKKENVGKGERKIGKEEKEKGFRNFGEILGKLGGRGKGILWVFRVSRIPA